MTPVDIANRVFQKKMRGLDPERVYHFLKLVSEEFETVLRERNQLKRDLKEHQIKEHELKERDELLKHTLANASKLADRLKEDAERESNLVLSAARQQADMIVRDAKDSLNRVYKEVSEMKRTRIQFENNLRALIQSHLAMMEQGQKMMPNPDIAVPSITSQSDEESLDQKVKKVIHDQLSPHPEMEV